MASTFVIYQQVDERRNQLIILHDIDELDRDRNGVRLPKALFQTEKVKLLSWRTDARALDQHHIPQQSTTTTSRVAIIANQWQSLAADVAALEDRGHLLIFDPARWWSTPRRLAGAGT